MFYRILSSFGISWTVSRIVHLIVEATWSSLCTKLKYVYFTEYFNLCSVHNWRGFLGIRIEKP